MTPWLPILLVVLATVGPVLLVWRWTRDPGLTRSTGMLILALASFALGAIMTVAFIAGGVLLLAVLWGFDRAWTSR